MQHLLWAGGWLLGDIPPPPPDIPGTHLTLPRPEQWVVAGVALSAALILGMRLLVGRCQPGPKHLTAGLAAVVLGASLLAAVYASGEYAAYSQRRRNFRGNGPVREPPVENLLPPIEEFAPDSAPAPASPPGEPT